MLKGTRVGLRPMNSEDVWLLYKWFNDQRVVENLGLRTAMFCVPMEEERRIVEAKLSSPVERNFIVVDMGADRAIGWAALSHIDQRNADAELHLVMGEVAERGTGKDEEAASLLVEHAFTVMNLHRIYTRVPEYDQAASSCLARAGFLTDGLMRDDHYHAGAYRSSYLMSRLRTEGKG